MSEDQFTKLFKYLQDMRQEMGVGFEDAKSDRADIRGALTELAGQIRDYNQEMLMLAHKVDRMEMWIHQIAEKTGVKLKFD